MSKAQFSDESDAITLLKLKKFYNNLLKEISDKYISKEDSSGFFAVDDAGYIVLTYELTTKYDAKFEIDKSGYAVLKEVNNGN